MMRFIRPRPPGFSANSLVGASTACSIRLARGLGTTRRQRSARRSARICLTTLRPGMPVTPPPPWVADPAWYRPRTGVRRSA